MTQNRFTYLPIWTALVSHIMSVLILQGVIDLQQSEVIEGVIIAILNCLTVFGVLNNPTNKDGF